MRHLVITQKITSVETTSFKQYLKDISEIRLFTPAQELECAIKASNGDKKAIDELVKRNLRFVVSVAKQYVTKDNPLEDLVNQGNIGLIFAAQKFKPDKGFKFISYAVWWVRKTIMEHITNDGRLVRFPANKIGTLSKLEGKITSLEQQLHRTPDIIEILDFCGEDIAPEEMKLLESMYIYNVDSLDRELDRVQNCDGTSSCLYEVFADESFKDTDHLVMEQDLAAEMRAMLNNIKPRDKAIIVMLYGLDGCEPMTLKEVGKKFNITREMVRQIRQKHLKNFRQRLTNASSPVSNT